MAYNPANLTQVVFNLSGVAGQGSFVWKYTTADNLATVEGSNYFLATPLIARNNDIIAVEASDGNRLYRLNTAGFGFATLQLWADVTSFAI